MWRAVVCNSQTGEVLAEARRPWPPSSPHELYKAIGRMLLARPEAARAVAPDCALHGVEGSEPRALRLESCEALRGILALCGLREG